MPKKKKAHYHYGHSGAVTAKANPHDASDARGAKRPKKIKPLHEKEVAKLLYHRIRRSLGKPALPYSKRPETEASLDAHHIWHDLIHHLVKKENFDKMVGAGRTSLMSGPSEVKGRRGHYGYYMGVGHDLLPKDFLKNPAMMAKYKDSLHSVSFVDEQTSAIPRTQGWAIPVGAGVKDKEENGIPGGRIYFALPPEAFENHENFLSALRKRKHIMIHEMDHHLHMHQGPYSYSQTLKHNSPPYFERPHEHNAHYGHFDYEFGREIQNNPGHFKYAFRKDGSHSHGMAMAILSHLTGQPSAHVLYPHLKGETKAKYDTMISRHLSRNAKKIMDAPEPSALEKQKMVDDIDAGNATARDVASGKIVI